MSRKSTVAWPPTNQKPAQTIASNMATTMGGTTGANLASGLHALVRTPITTWTYLYAASGTGSQLHSKVVTDTYDYGMSLELPVKPHDPGQTYFLTS